MTLDYFILNHLRQFKSLRVTGWIIWTLEKLYGTRETESKLAFLRTLEKGTAGREIADMLDKNGFRLIPKFESHDLKHVVLDYEMTMPNEIRMQAYLIGNGNYSFPCLIFFTLGIFYPEVWKDLAKEYRAGKASNSILHLTLDNCMNSSLKELKIEFGRVKYF